MFFVKVLWFCGSCGFLALRILTSSDPMLFLFKTSQNGGKLISWWWSNIQSVLNAWRFCGFVVSSCGFLALQILTPSSPIFSLQNLTKCNTMNSQCSNICCEVSWRWMFWDLVVFASLNPILFRHYIFPLENLKEYWSIMKSITNSLWSDITWCWM